MNTPQQLHLPVLLQQVLEQLAPRAGQTYLDLTAGYGGHASKVIAAVGDAHLATLVDRDEFAIANLQQFAKAGARVIKSDYWAAAKQFVVVGEQFDLILLDLGVSSPQVDIAERGFSFMAEGPLDMRMDQSQGQTAADVCNTASQEDLVRILREYGEEPQARKIAQAIIRSRPLTTTTQLADVVAHIYRGRKGKTHPATRTFQALRIAVNQELQQLDETLKLLPDLLAPGGRVAIISFHSLEDRLVKHFFKEEHQAGYEARLQILTKQPVSGAIYDVHNPRSRSAKLRVAVKIK